MTTVAEKQRVAVIGGGLAGLSAAVNLARHGLAVTLFERSPHMGGRAQTTLKDGYHINFGPHAFYLGGPGHSFLQDLGIETAGSAPPIANAVGFYKGRTPILPLSLGAIFKTDLFSLADKLRLIKLMLRLNSINENDFESLTVNAWIDLDKDLCRAGDALKSFVRALIQLSTYTRDTDKMSARAGLYQLKSAVRNGVRYLHGGWAQLVDALVDKARELEVTLVAGCEVIEVSRNSQNGDFNVAFKDKTKGLLRESFSGLVLAAPPEVVKMITSAKAMKSGQIPLNLGGDELVDVKAACLDICLSELPRPEMTYSLGLDEPLYYSVHSSAAQLTPPNGALIHAAYYLKHGETGTPQIEKRLEEMVDTLQPGWREKLVYKRFLANITVVHKILSIKEGKLGGYWTEETDEPGVYRAGDWVGVEQLADSSLASAKRSSELLVAHLESAPKSSPNSNSKERAYWSEWQGARAQVHESTQ